MTIKYTTSLQLIRAICLLTPALLFCNNISSQKTSDSLNLHLHLDEVLVSKSQPLQHIKSITPSQSISKTEIESQGIQSMADAVRRFAGVIVKDYGGIGGLKTVSVRGFGATHTAISLDGITMSNAQSGQIDIGKFSLNPVALISLEIGQTNNIFQPARNFSSAGILHITSQAPEFSSKSYVITPKIKIGSFGQKNPSLFFGKDLSKNKWITLYGEWQKADGNYPFKFDTGNNVEQRKRHNSDVDIQQGGINFHKQDANKHSFSWVTNYYYARRGLPGSAITGVYTNHERLNTRTIYTQMNNTLHINPQWKWQTSAKLTYNYDLYTNADTKYTNSMLINRFRQTEYYASSAVQYTPSSAWKFSVATDYAHNYLYMFFRESGIADINYPPQNRAYRNTYLLATNGSFETGRWLLVGNILGAVYLEKTQTGTPPANKRKITPAIALRYQILPNWYSRLSYKSIYRVPTFNDMYYTQIGNRLLQPELAKQINIGSTLRKYFPHSRQSIEVSIDAYLNRVTNKIVATPSMFVWRMQNKDKVKILGFDTKVSYFKNLSSEIELRINGSYSYQNAKDANTKMQIIYTPQHTAGASLSLQTNWINFAYTLVASSSQWTTDYHIKLNQVEAYADHSISLNRTWNLSPKVKCRLQIDLLNLTNKNYEIIKNYPMPGRAFALSAGVEF